MTELQDAPRSMCECETDGFCKRYNRHMIGRLRQICRGENIDPGEAAKYRALWAGETTNGTPQTGICPHRTAEPLQENGHKKTRKCQTCQGHVEQILFGCNHPALAPHETTLAECTTCQHRPKPITGKPLVLMNRLCPGDVLAMSAAVFSLHRANPGVFATAVDTTAMQLWEHNPDIVPAEKLENPTKLEMHYPAIHQADQRAIHFMQGFCEYLAEALQVKVPLVTNRPMVYLSNQEKSWMGQVQEMTGRPTRYWIVNAGCKSDYPAKWWGLSSYQRVVDSLRGRIVFVQVGETGHNHPPLRGVLNLVGKTDTRQLVRLFHHADGVLGPVSFTMHLAAALEKPAVTIMGGREPVVWNSYPRQTLMHTVGALDCCRGGGCWKSRIVKQNDNDEKDTSICEQPIPGDEAIGRCMGLISPEAVVESILRYT